MSSNWLRCTHDDSLPFRSYMCSLASIVIMTGESVVSSCDIRVVRSVRIAVHGLGSGLSSLMRCRHCWENDVMLS